MSYLLLFHKQQKGKFMNNNENQQVMLTVEEYEDYKNYMQLKERDSKKAEVDKLEKKVIRLKDKIKEINEQKQIIKKKYRL